MNIPAYSTLNIRIIQPFHLIELIIFMPDGYQNPCGTCGTHTQSQSVYISVKFTFGYLYVLHHFRHWHP